MESDGVGAVRKAGHRFVDIRQPKDRAVSSQYKKAGSQWISLFLHCESSVGSGALARKRDRATAQRHCLRGAGRLRGRDDERGEDGDREDALPECLPRWRSGTQFESEWEDSSIGPDRKILRSARRFG